MVLLLGGLVVQRCDYNRRLATLREQSTQAGTQLVETTRELGAERVEQAKEQAKAKRTAVAKHVRDEVAHATDGNSDFADWVNERVQRAGN